MEPSNLRVQRALRECSSCFLAGVVDGASLVWEVPRSRSQIWSSYVRELLQLYDEQSFRELSESFMCLNSFFPTRVSGFDQIVAQMLARRVLNATNSGRPEYEQCFRCIVLKSTVQQVLSRC